MSSNQSVGQRAAEKFVEVFPMTTYEREVLASIIDKEVAAEQKSLEDKDATGFKRPASSAP